MRLGATSKLYRSRWEAAKDACRPLADWPETCPWRVAIFTVLAWMAPDDVARYWMAAIARDSSQLVQAREYGIDVAILACFEDTRRRPGLTPDGPEDSSPAHAEGGGTKPAGRKRRKPRKFSRVIGFKWGET